VELVGNWALQYDSAAQEALCMDLLGRVQEPQFRFERRLAGGAGPKPAMLSQVAAPCGGGLAARIGEIGHSKQWRAASTSTRGSRHASGWSPTHRHSVLVRQIGDYATFNRDGATQAGNCGCREALWRPRWLRRMAGVVRYWRARTASGWEWEFQSGRGPLHPEAPFAHHQLVRSDAYARWAVAPLHKRGRVEAVGLCVKSSRQGQMAVERYAESGWAALAVDGQS